MSLSVRYPKRWISSRITIVTEDGASVTFSVNFDAA